MPPPRRSLDLAPATEAPPHPENVEGSKRSRYERGATRRHKKRGLKPA